MLRSIRLTPLAAILLAAACALAATAEEAVRELVPFRIKDQHDHLHTDARYRGAPLLVLWGDREGAKVMNSWGPALADSLAPALKGYRLRLLEVAHGKGAPFFIKGKIKGSFRTEGRGPVLMDWDGLFARTYDPVKDHGHAWLFDAEGVLRRSWSAAPPDTALPADLLTRTRELAR